MTRYHTNALLRRVNLDPAELAAYQADPAGYVAAARSAGTDLTDAEFEALATADYAALYTMGAHPYLMWGFIEAVWVPARLSRGELVSRFREAVGGIPQPDVRTTPAP